MTQYVKLISEKEIEYAPYEKNGIINYNCEANEIMLFADNYKKFITIERPETDRYYEIQYEIKSDTEITEIVVYTETEEEYTTRKFTEAKTTKSQENSVKRNAVDRIKANFSAKVSGYLLKSTPVGDIMTVVMGLALPAMMAQQSIPAGSMRYYDSDNEPHLTPEIKANYVSTFYSGFANNIAKIDTYSTYIEVQIANATTIEEVNAIEINYDFDNIEEVLSEVNN